MSTIGKTPNIGLTQYENVKYPLFLGDYTKDMELIDSLVQSINTDIDDIQRIIDTVSTQNIDNLTARLGALEVKVDNNTNVINSLISSLNGLQGEVDKNKNRITNIIAELEIVKNDIADLKSCCEDVRATLAQHGSAISENTNAINDINENIDRMKLDIIGNAQDIQTVASQLSNIIASKQDKLIAGTGVSIVDNVISTTGGGGVIGTYSDGNLILG